ncbi:MAG TPA: efflux RND transporter permease subunit, partial [Steroidobacteraceae bacterium]|nr:efflux RND transporter permease subunit [Steroidobacteraceae bacterium]
GRLFREFAITLSAAILVSLVVSLTTTPMMCSRVTEEHGGARQHGRLYRFSERAFNTVQDGYRRSLDWALANGATVMLILAVTVALNVYLYIRVPKGFFPQQDTGLMMGNIQADQAISFQAMREKLQHFVDVVRHDPAVNTVVGFTGGGQRNGGNMFISLKPRAQRGMTADAVIARLRGKLGSEPGANLFLQPVQDIRVGGRSAGAQYQYTLQADTITDLRAWEPRVRRMMNSLPLLADVNTDAQDKGLQTSIVIDHDAVARLGLNQAEIDGTLNDLFGQRQVSTIYHPLNQYHVVMEAAPEYWQSPDTLRNVYVTSTAATGAAATRTAGTKAPNTTTTGATPTATSATGTSTTGQRVPLSDFSHYEPTSTPLAVNHQGLSAASTISFNLPLGVSLSQATQAINNGFARLGAPITVRGTFQGTAKAFQDALSNQPLLILSALVAVYLVLGILYESLVHPLTILSTLPSAGVGALLALLATGQDFTIIALIGVILLIGIVKKNAIMMIDFALQIERERDCTAREAIYEACLLRLRPILMTTMAAMFGALPLAIGTGDGAELRRPLGIAVVGGLLLSQLLTLYTTPVMYVYLDRFRLWAKSRLQRFSNPLGSARPRGPGKVRGAEQGAS